MDTFKKFISEIYLPAQNLWEHFITESTSERDNDDMGKLHELRVAYHLSHEDPKQRKLPEHHRSVGKEDPKHNGDPQTVHDNILARMHPEKADMIDKGSEASANAWKRKHVMPGEKIGQVFWTSNRDTVKKNGDLTPGDHFKTTGIHDPNSNADLIAKIVNHKGDHIRWEPISAKIGKNDPNLANPGISSLEKMSGHEEGHFARMEEPHTDHVINLGYHSGSRDDRHAQWKIDSLAADEKRGVEAVRKEVNELKQKHQSGETLAAKHKKYIEHGDKFLSTYDKSSPKEKESMLAKAKHRAQSAIDSSLHIRKQITKKISNGLINKVKTDEHGNTDDSELRTTLFKNFAPQTAFKHSIIYSKISSDGKSITPEIHAADDYAKSHFNRFKNLKVTSVDGTSSYVKGIVNDPEHPKHGKEMNVAQITVKGSSGPMMGNVGSMSLMNKKSENP